MITTDIAIFAVAYIAYALGSSKVKECISKAQKNVINKINNGTFSLFQQSNFYEAHKEKVFIDDTDITDLLPTSGSCLPEQSDALKQIQSLLRVGQNVRLVQEHINLTTNEVTILKGETFPI